MPNVSIRGFARAPQMRQRLVHVIAARVDGTGTAAILEGGNEMTLTDNGTGDYTLTFNTAFARVPVVTALPISATGDVILSISSVAVGSVRIKAWDGTDGTTAKDIAFHVMIVGFDAADAV